MAKKQEDSGGSEYTVPSKILNVRNITFWIP